MNSIRVSSWNAENALGDSRNFDAVEQMAQLDADFIYIPETARDSPEVGDRQAETTDRLQVLGYNLLNLTDYYNGVIPYGHQRHFMSMWTRIDQFDAETVLLGERYGIRADKTNGPTITGVHAEDYRESDRVDASQAVIHLQELEVDRPQVIMGDFNAMAKEDKRAKALKSIHWATEAVRSALGDSLEYYGDTKTITEKLAHFASLGIRLTDMSAGDSMGILRDAGFQNADSSYQPTIGVGRGGKPIFKIDHILGKNVGFDNYHVHSTKKPLSDHSPISSRVVW